MSGEVSLESHSFCDSLFLEGFWLVIFALAKVKLMLPDVRTRYILLGGGEKLADGGAIIEKRMILVFLLNVWLQTRLGIQQCTSYCTPFLTCTSSNGFFEGQDRLHKYRPQAGWVQPPVPNWISDSLFVVEHPLELAETFNKSKDIKLAVAWNSYFVHGSRLH